MRFAATTLLACTLAAPCPAQEPVGCDKFKWPLDKERATFNGTDLPKVVSGDGVKWPIPWATIVALVPYAEAKFPLTQERAPKAPGTFAAVLQVSAPPRAGVYKITLSSEGWVDVVQGSQIVKSTDFTGATGCDGVRKSVKFDLAAKPFALELSGVAADTIRIAISGQ